MWPSITEATWGESGNSIQLKMEKSTLFLLLLSQILMVSSFPVCPINDDEIMGDRSTEGSGVLEEVEEEETRVEEETPVIPGIHDYIFRFFQNQRELKEKKCTTTFLGQNVSQHLCSSNQVVFLTARGKYNTSLTLPTILLNYMTDNIIILAASECNH